MLFIWHKYFYPFLGHEKRGGTGMGNMLGGKELSIVYLWKNRFLCLQFMSCNSNASSSSGKRITEVLAFFFPCLYPVWYVLPWGGGWRMLLFLSSSSFPPLVLFSYSHNDHIISLRGRNTWMISYGPARNVSK